MLVIEAICQLLLIHQYAIYLLIYRLPRVSISIFFDSERVLLAPVRRFTFFKTLHFRDDSLVTAYKCFFAVPSPVRDKPARLFLAMLDAMLPSGHICCCRFLRLSRSLARRRYPL